MRRAARALLFAWGLSALPSRAEAPAAAPSAAAFPVRMVKIGGAPGDPATREHLEFSAAAGYNALFVYSAEAGSWSGPGKPALAPAFLDVCAFCRERGLRIFVSLNPVADSQGAFVFSERDGAKRIKTFFRLLERRCDVADFVLSFDDQPRTLTNVRDIATYGPDAARAHLDLARRVLKPRGRRGSRWLAAAVYSDWQLDDRDYEPYASTFLEGLARLDPRIGIAWTGPDTISESITRDDLVATRARLGGREILLADNYPANDDYERQAIALILGPLRNRDPRLREVLSVYLAVPMSELGASRLALASIAEFLNDPAGYDPERSARDAIRRLAGDDPGAREALETQAIEWGGFVGTLNYHYDDASPESVASDLDNPALMATWSYTLKRYPERMAALSRASDRAFREDVLQAMARRYAIARALGPVLELRASKAPEARDPADLLRTIQTERNRVAADANVKAALDRFLDAAGILKILAP